MDELREYLLKILDKNTSETSEGVVLTIRVEEDPRENYLTIENDEVVFKTRDAGNNSRCNSSLIGYLSTSLKIPSSRIDIVHGSRGGYVKRVLIMNTKREELERKLLRILRLV
jgi:uncharacterized protein YggU (UPF0235/DUF167 family)